MAVRDAQGEETLRQMEPCPLHRSELRRLGRHRNEGDVRWRRARPGPMPAGAVEPHDGGLVPGGGPGDAVEEDPHRVGAASGQDQREGGFAIGPGGAEEAGPVAAPIPNSGRALAARPPAMTGPPLSHRRACSPGKRCTGAFSCRAQRDMVHPLAGIGLGGGRQRSLEPPFSTRRCACSSVFRVGRARLPARKARVPETARQAQRRQPLVEAILDPAAGIGQRPAAHAVGGGIGAADDARRQERQLCLRQRGRAARRRPVMEAVEPFGVAAHDLAASARRSIPAAPARLIPSSAIAIAEHPPAARFLFSRAARARSAAALGSSPISSARPITPS